MDAGLQQSSMQDPGLGLPGSRAPGSIAYSIPGTDPFTQSTNQSSSQGYTSNPNEQDLFTNTYNGGSFTPDGNLLSVMSNQPSAYSALSMGNNGNFTNTGNVFDDSLSLNTTTSNQYGEIGRQWSSFPYPATAPQFTSTPSQNAYYYPQASAQSLSLNQIQPFAESYMHSVPTQIQQGMQQSQTQTQPIAASNPLPAIGLLPAPNPLMQIQQSRPYTPFPQSGVTPSGVGPQRRHQRTSSLASAPITASGTQPIRTASQHVRARSRPTATASAAHSPQPSSQIQGSQDSAVIPASTGPATRSIGNSDRQITHRQHQHAASNRSAQLRSLLRSMRAGGAQALQMYEETLIQGTRYASDLDGYGTSPPPKELDAPHESRPEPKETEEMTLNLECKICMSQLVDTVVLPCGHAILCRWCADQHIPSIQGFPKGKANCPMCREPVKQKYRIYFP